MEAVVVDAGSKLLKAGIALPDQAPALVSVRISPAHLEGAEFRAFLSSGGFAAQVMPSKMKLEVEDQQLADGAVVEEVVQPVVRGFVKDWDAMEDLLNYALYQNIGWEIGDEGQILFTEPLFTPKVTDFLSCYN
jgi:actin-related protein 7, plant